MYTVDVVVQDCAGSTGSCGTLDVESRSLGILNSESSIVRQVGQDDALIESAIFGEEEGGHEGKDGEGDYQFK